MNEFSIFNNKLEENKLEKIAFIIDLSQDILLEDFIDSNNNKVERLKLILDEISNFVKLKDYFSSRSSQFAIYSYTSNLNIEIDFCDVSDFDLFFQNILFNLRKKVSQSMDYLDLSQIFTDAIRNLNTSSNKSKALDSELIYRYILIYNRSNLPVLNKNLKEYNTMNFIRMTNFCFDVIFLRKKIKDDEDKKKLNDIYNSLTSVRPNFWYAMEISGNINKFKFSMSLLLANKNQRIKLSDIDNYQKNIDELIRNYIDN